MVPYHHNWDAFSKAVIALYHESPVKTRYCVRWRHDAGLLVIRATDDKKVVKFKARSAIFLNRFDALTRTLMTKMQAAPVVNPAFAVPTPAPASAPASAPAAPSKAVGALAQAEPAKAAGGGTSGGKKKKGKKKK